MLFICFFVSLGLSHFPWWYDCSYFFLKSRYSDLVGVPIVPSCVRCHAYCSCHVSLSMPVNASALFGRMVRLGSCNSKHDMKRCDKFSRSWAWFRRCGEIWCYPATQKISRNWSTIWCAIPMLQFLVCLGMWMQHRGALKHSWLPFWLPFGRQG